jgi:hypothetical protein
MDFTEAKSKYDMQQYSKREQEKLDAFTNLSSAVELLIAKKLTGDHRWSPMTTDDHKAGSSSPLLK